MRLYFRSLVVVVSLCSICGLTPAQTSINGSLRGRVTDSNGGAVVGARVTLTNTGNTSLTVSDKHLARRAKSRVESGLSSKRRLARLDLRDGRDGQPRNPQRKKCKL
jgi:hypothetical protein